jgi:hypothetical protein
MLTVLNDASPPLLLLQAMKVWRKLLKWKEKKEFF